MDHCKVSQFLTLSSHTHPPQVASPQAIHKIFQNSENLSITSIATGVDKKAFSLPPGLWHPSCPNPPILKIIIPLLLPKPPPYKNSSFQHHSNSPSKCNDFFPATWHLVSIWHSQKLPSLENSYSCWYFKNNHPGFLPPH